jgi:hypothetical protein
MLRHFLRIPAMIPLLSQFHHSCQCCDDPIIVTISLLQFHSEEISWLGLNPIHFKCLKPPEAHCHRATFGRNTRTDVETYREQTNICTFLLVVCSEIAIKPCIRSSGLPLCATHRISVWQFCDDHRELCSIMILYKSCPFSYCSIPLCCVCDRKFQRCNYFVMSGSSSIARYCFQLQVFIISLFCVYSIALAFATFCCLNCKVSHWVTVRKVANCLRGMFCICISVTIPMCVIVMENILTLSEIWTW